MKHLLVLLLFTVCTATAAIASTDPEVEGDPEKTQSESQYKFSLSNSYFSIFNLFSVEPARKDTATMDEAILKSLEERPK